MPHQSRQRTCLCWGAIVATIETPSSSMLTFRHHLYLASLTQVRQDWGIKESVGPTGWQAVMRQYLRQDRQAATVLAGQGGCSPFISRRQAEPCTEGGFPRCGFELACVECLAEVCCKTYARSMDS